MKKIISIVLIGLILSGCSFFRVHKIDIEQGNLFSDNEVSRLHAGMSEAQVKEVMGTPVFMNIFTPNRLDYVYTYQPGYGALREKRVICVFIGGRLKEVIRR